MGWPKRGPKIYILEQTKVSLINEEELAAYIAIHKQTGLN